MAIPFAAEAAEGIGSAAEAGAGEASTAKSGAGKSAQSAKGPQKTSSGTTNKKSSGTSNKKQKSKSKPGGLGVSLPKPGKIAKSAGHELYNGKIVAEFLIGVVLIFISVFNKDSGESYETIMARLMLRLSALSGVFFILALLSTGKRSGRFAAAFGLLIDVGILFNAVRDGSIGTLSGMTTGKQIVQSADMQTDTVTEPPHNIVGAG